MGLFNFEVLDPALVEEFGQKNTDDLTHEFLTECGWNLFRDEDQFELPVYHYSNREIDWVKYEPNSCKKISEFLKFLFEEGKKIGIGKGKELQVQKNRELLSELLCVDLGLVGQHVTPTLYK